MDVPLTILLLMACVFTTYTKGSNSLQLTSSPATASPGQSYTLMCSSNSSAGKAREWHWMNDIVFRTRYVTDTQCTVDVSNNNLYNYLSGRINVTCSHNQHNVTLGILTSIDNGSVCWCVDTVSSQESNRLTIHVVNLLSMSSTTTTAETTTTAAATTTTVPTSTTATTATATMPVTTATKATTTTAVKSDSSSPDKSHQKGGSTDADNQVVYIAAGVGGGVAVVIVVVISVLCIRRRRGRNVNNGSAHEHKHEASHTYYNENRDLQDQDINDKVQDVYAKVQKPKKNTPKPTGTADDINMEDLYAKPDKTKIRKKQED